jgi:integrase
MATLKTKLTQRSVQTLPEPSVAWDSDLPGFMLITSPLGTRTYFVQRRDKDGKQRKVKIGRHDILGSARARTKAEQLLAQLTLGTLPERKRKAPASEAAPTTLAELWARHQVERQTVLSEQSLKSYKSQWKRHLSRLGARDLASIDRPLVESWHREITADTGKVAANKALVLLKSVMNFAVLRDWLGRNPCHGVGKHREHGRETFLNRGQIDAVMTILSRDSAVVDKLIAFLLATGCRKGEALAALWSDVDLDSGTWRQRHETTKTQRTQYLPLSPEAVELLHSLPRRGVRVFHGVDASRLQRRWVVVRTEAGLPTARVHDLRHSHASLVAASGGSLLLIGKLLGHAQVATTARYAHLVDEQLREATKKVGAVLGNVLTFKKPA